MEVEGIPYTSDTGVAVFPVPVSRAVGRERIP